MFIVVGIFLQIQIFLNHWILLHFERIFLNSICFYFLLLQLKWWRRGGLFRITASNASPDPMMWTMFSFDLAKGAEQTNLMEQENFCWKKGNIKQQHNNSFMHSLHSPPPSYHQHYSKRNVKFSLSLFFIVGGLESLENTKDNLL